MTFPNSKIELHQWFNSGLLLVVGFFVTQTYFTIAKDHEVIANHETRISVLEATGKQSKQTSRSFHDAMLPKEFKMESE